MLPVAERQVKYADNGSNISVWTKERRAAGQKLKSVTSEEGKKKEEFRVREGMSEEEKGDATRQEEQWKTKEAPHSAPSYLSAGSYPPPALLV